MEFSLRAIILGILLALVLGAANAYLGLKVGMTVSASIPAAVISFAILRWFRHATILENNLVQTAASAGEAAQTVSASEAHRRQATYHPFAPPRRP